MSLTVDGVWKAGVWAQTVWADGVWYEPSSQPAQQYSGGWFDPPTGKRKTKAQLRLEREEWGVLPKKAKALIKRVAAQQVERIEPLDNTEALVAAFNRAEMAYREEFRVLYLREVERQLAKMREEEEILLLLH